MMPGWFHSPCSSGINMSSAGFGAPVSGFGHDSGSVTYSRTSFHHKSLILRVAKAVPTFAVTSRISLPDVVAVPRPCRFRRRLRCVRWHQIALGFGGCVHPLEHLAAVRGDWSATSSTTALSVAQRHSSSSCCRTSQTSNRKCCRVMWCDLWQAAWAVEEEGHLLGCSKRFVSR